MIAEHILGNVQDGVTETVVNIPFEWFETEKKRIAKTAEDGTEFGVCVGVPLHDGDILARENGKVYAVHIAPSHLIETHAAFAVYIVCRAHGASGMAHSHHHHHE